MPTNLSPRALVLNLGHGLLGRVRYRFAAGGRDLERAGAFRRTHWRQGSYLRPDKKTPGGQTPAPEPLGTVWVANGIYPGWQARRAACSFSDPREPAPTVDGSGARSDPRAHGAVRSDPAAVERRQPRVHRRPDGGYRVDNRARRKAQVPTVARHFKIAASDTPLSSCSAARPTTPTSPWRRIPRRRTASRWRSIRRMERRSRVPAVHAAFRLKAEATSAVTDRNLWVARVPAHRRPVEFSVLLSSRAPKAIDGGRECCTARRANAPAGAGI